jgi:histidinol-phosphate aminotransferase
MTIRPRVSLLNSDLERPSALSSIPRDIDLLWLDKNENLDPELNALAKEILASIPSLALNSYPEAGELYKKLASWVGLSPQSLLLTPGSDGAIRLVFETFVEQNDIVVHTFPTFAMYSVYGKAFGAKVYRIEYELKNGSIFIDKNKIIDRIINLKPKLVCIPNPDSPSGTIFLERDLHEILLVCESSGTLLLIDEAYHPFYERSYVKWTRGSKNLIVARTFAKAWGLAGLRIGYAVGNPETINLLHKMRPMYEVGTLAVEFMSRMLDHSSEMEHSVKRIKESKLFFENEMRAINLDVLKTEANFSFVKFGEKEELVHARLKTEVLYRKQIDHYAFKGYSRFSISTRSNMESIVHWIKELI